MFSVTSILLLRTNFYVFKRRVSVSNFIENNAVDIATGYGVDDRGIGVPVPVEARIFTSPRRPDRLWGGPPRLLLNGYRELFPWG
jgi:hypothetical protein